MTQMLYLCEPIINWKNDSNENWLNICNLCRFNRLQLKIDSEENSLKNEQLNSDEEDMSSCISNDSKRTYYSVSTMLFNIIPILINIILKIHPRRYSRADTMRSCISQPDLSNLDVWYIYKSRIVILSFIYY